MRSKQLFYQKNRIDCGICCVKMILSTCEIEDVNDINFKPDSDSGYSAKALLDIFKKKKINAYCVRVLTKEFKNISKYALILYLKRKHFVLFEEVKGEKVFYFDPAFGRISMSLLEFEKIYDGIAIAVEIPYDTSREKQIRVRIKQFVEKCSVFIENSVALKPGVEFVIEDINKSKLWWKVCSFGRLLLAITSIIIISLLKKYDWILLFVIINMICLIDSSALYQEKPRRIIGNVLQSGLIYFVCLMLWKNINSWTVNLVVIVMVGELFMNINYKEMISTYYRTLFR